MDIFESDEELLNEYYNKDNYFVEEIDVNRKKCLLCFSSHATYYPFTREAFIEKIIQEDRYEFKNITKSKKIRKQFGKIIYVRDLYREWYVRGMNSRENCIDKIISKMRELTAGYKIVTAGTSSGGYLATIVGIKLEAEVIYNFSGQYSLKQWEKRKWLSKYATDWTRSKYYNIVDMINESNIPIIYCYPSKSEDNIKQAEMVKDCESIIPFAFDYKVHGQTVYPYNYKYLFEKRVDSLKKLSKKLRGRSVKASVFLIFTGGVGGFIDNIRGIWYLLFGKKRKKSKGYAKVL